MVAWEDLPERFLNGTVEVMHIDQNRVAHSNISEIRLGEDDQAAGSLALWVYNTWRASTVDGACVEEQTIEGASEGVSFPLSHCSGLHEGDDGFVTFTFLGTHIVTFFPPGHEHLAMYEQLFSQWPPTVT